jgi:hypothetical protein
MHSIVVNASPVTFLAGRRAAKTGGHLWANRFDGTPEDIFDLQDLVTASVVGAIIPKLEEVEFQSHKIQTN